MRALRIPRKDHDVYCLDITGKSKRHIWEYIDEQLLRMHPVYGADTAVDVKTLKHNDHEWAIVMVMQKETLEEYRILYPHTAFVTATSLAVFKKDFFTKEVHVCGCERIRFDAQRQLIISEESGIEGYVTEGCNLEGKEDKAGGTDSPDGEMGVSDKRDDIPQEREERVTHVGRRSVVFSRKRNAYVTAGIGLSVILAVALTAYSVWTAVYAAQQVTVPPEHRDTAERERGETPTVTPCRFLEIIAEHTPVMQAVLERYRYTGAEGALCTFRSGSLGHSITEFQSIPYRTGCTIKEIIQKDKEIVITVQTDPAILQPVFIPTVDPAAIAGFTDALKASVIRNGTSIRYGRHAQITMDGLSITCSALVGIEAIDAFLHDIETVTDRYAFDMAVLEIAVAEADMLSVHAEVQQTGASGTKTKEQAVQRVEYTSPVIARAFGYAEQTPAKAVHPTVRKLQKPANTGPVIPEGSIEIGKIQTNGKVKTYYRTPEGKIISIETS